MVGTSLAMAPIMSLECFADYIDLDGPLLLLKDRKSSMNYEKGYNTSRKKRIMGLVQLNLRYTSSSFQLYY
jgi:hypothetical protein